MSKTLKARILDYLTKSGNDKTIEEIHRNSGDPKGAIHKTINSLVKAEKVEFYKVYRIPTRHKSLEDAVNSVLSQLREWKNHENPNR